MKYTTDDIKQILASPEGETLEFKTAVPPASTLREIIAGFANADGGRIVIGYDDVNKTVRGVPAIALSQVRTILLKEQLTGSCEVSVVYYEGKELLIVDVSRSPGLVLINGLAYIRRGDKTFRLKSSEYREYIARREEKGDDEPSDNAELLRIMTEQAKALSELTDKFEASQKKSLKISIILCILSAIISVILTAIFLS